MLSRAKMIIAGKVQGVLFRDGLYREARVRGLNGFARNLPTGEVEAVVEGEKEQINSFLDWARLGPPSAKVVNFDFHWEDYKNEFYGFLIF